MNDKYLQILFQSRFQIGEYISSFSRTIYATRFKILIRS